MARNNETNTKNIVFSIVDINSASNKTLIELARLTRALWSEFDYPHETHPLEFYKRYLAFQYRSDQKNIYILMNDKTGKSIGFCKLFVNTGPSNRSVSLTNFYIQPEFRRQGYFKELFLYSTKVVPNYVKIFKFFFRVDDNQKFPKENQSLDKKLSDLSDLIGGKLAFMGRRSEVDLTKHSMEVVSLKAKELKQKAKENGYSIVFVDDITFPGLPFTLTQYVKMLERLRNDMPWDDMTPEITVITEEDFLNWFKFDKEGELNEWIYIAVTKDGLPIAMTETRIYSGTPHIANVGETGVLREHRGEKLGLTLKYLMLQRLLSNPMSKDKVKYWITFNAKSNKHMIAINDELGFVQSSLEHTYELPLDKLKEYFLLNKI